LVYWKYTRKHLNKKRKASEEVNKSKRQRVDISRGPKV